MTEQPSGRLYSVVTKHWAKIAAALVGVLGLIELVLGGLTADSSVEFYLMAWAGTTGGLWFLFEKAEKALSEESRGEVVAWMGKKDFRVAFKSIPNQFATLFDRIFGERHWSRRSFNRSCVASLFSVFAIAMIGGIVGLRPDPGFFEVAGAWYLLAWLAALLFGVVPFNFLPDYASLLETRWAIKVMDRSGRVVPLLLADLIATAVISLAGISLVSVLLLLVPDIMNWALGPPGAVDLAVYVGVVQDIAVSLVASAPETPGTVISTIYIFDEAVRIHSGELDYWVRISFLSAFFTSAWLWLYAGSVILSRVLVRMNDGVGFLLRVTDVEKQPFRSMGFVSVIITSVLFALGLPLVLL